MASSYIVLDIQTTCNQLQPQEILKIAAFKLNKDTLDPEAGFLQDIKPRHHIHENNAPCALVGRSPGVKRKRKILCSDLDHVLKVFIQWIVSNHGKLTDDNRPVMVYNSKEAWNLFNDSMTDLDTVVSFGDQPLILADVYAKHFAVKAKGMLGLKSMKNRLGISEKEDLSEESPFFFFDDDELKDCRGMARLLQALVRDGVKI